MAIAYPSVNGDTYFIAFTYMGHNKIEHPIVFAARYLTRNELKFGMLTTLVRVVAWSVSRMHWYIIFAVEVRIFVPIIVNT